MALDYMDKDFINHKMNELVSSINSQTNKIVDAIKSLKEPKQELPEYVETNLNDYVKVKLNEHGREIHRKFWEPYCGKNLPYKYPEVDSEGYSKFQIHEFMLTFGSECSIGSSPFCEGNNILIQRSR